MEGENKEKQEKLSYEELNKNFTDLYIGYQKLMAEHRKLREEHAQAVSALQARDFDYMSFFLSMLFKVMEHPEMYKEEFVDWASKNIEATLVAFQESMKEPENEEKAPNENENKNAAE